MPTFSRDVPHDPRGPAFPIVRTPTFKALVAIATSPDLVGTYTHFFHGRTMPCEGKGCGLCMDGKTPTAGNAGIAVHVVNKIEITCDGPACEACQVGIPFRWHAYFSALITETGLHCLFEVTAQAADHFTEYRDAHGTLRGCKFEARRLNNRPNGRILIRCKPADLTQINLPNPPDIIRCLSILWDFPADDVQPTHINPEKKTRTVKHKPKKENPQ